jgi:hypothetical protein
MRVLVVEDEVRMSRVLNGLEEGHAVDRYVTYLRRKVDTPFGRRDLETGRGMGYRLRHAGQG